MGYIYCITNKINDKKYIGKTSFSVEKRWLEHLKDYKKKSKEKRALYDAMKKYGSHNFICETICECSDNDLDANEQKFIEIYNTFHNGYNLTNGGDGKNFYNHDEIKNFYINNEVTITETALQFNCNVDTVKAILKKFHITPRNLHRTQYFGSCNKPKQIFCHNADYTEQYEFNSVTEAATWLFDNKKCKSNNSGVRGHICDCANGKSNSAYGFIWNYKEDIQQINLST